MPRWVALLAGHPQANGLVRDIFSGRVAIPLTYLFTILETFGAVALILGLLTRLVSVWAIFEFAITGMTGLVMGSSGLMKDFGLLARALVLVLNGSLLLRLDGGLAKTLT